MSDALESELGAGVLDPKSDPQYIQFQTLPAESGKLNRWSNAITRGHDFPGAQVRSLMYPITPLPTCKLSREVQPQY